MLNEDRQADLQIPLVYIAGRYRSSPEYLTTIEDNLSAAEFTGKLATERGWYPVIPHLNTSFFKYQNDNFFPLAAQRLLLSCDAMLLVQGWDDSQSVIEEVKLATKEGMSIYQTASAMPYMSQYYIAQGRWNDFFRGQES